MKNVWILNHYAITPDMPGGTRHYDFAKELVKRGYGVTIFASSFHYGLYKELKLSKNEKSKIENVDGINFVWIKTFPYQKNDWRRVINMISYMWRSYFLGNKITKINPNIKKPNVIIGSSVHLLAVLSAYWLSKKYKVKFIMEVRDLWPQTLIDFKKFKKNNIIIKILQFLEKFLYKKAKKIVILPPLADKYITSIGINKNKIIWIPNGVNLTKFQEIEKRRISQYFKVIYTGALGVSSGLKNLLLAAKITWDRGHRNIQFYLVGSGPEKQNLLKLKDKLKLNNITFLDAIPKKDIAELLMSADAMLHIELEFGSSKYGGSPNKIFDYMATRKPIIYASNFVKDWIDKINCGIYALPENPESIAKAIIKLYKMSSEERKKMGQRGREYVEKYHSIPVLVDKLEKVIQEVAQ